MADGRNKRHVFSFSKIALWQGKASDSKMRLCKEVLFEILVSLQLVEENQSLTVI